MEFFDYTTTYNFVNKYTSNKQNYIEFYDEALQAAAEFRAFKHAYQAVVSHNQFKMEKDWLGRNRPYYNVYPGIVKYLIKFKEERVMAPMVRLPTPTLLLRFSKNDPNFKFDWEGKTYQLRTILAGDFVETDVIPHNTSGRRTLTCWMDFGEEETITVSGMELVKTVHTYRKLLMQDDLNIERAMNSLKVDPNIHEGLQIPQEFVDNAVRLTCALCLVSRDKEDGLIEPDVIAADRPKWLDTHDAKYVDKAHRRGKFGWNVGSNIEIMPHYRGPSPTALYWSGPNKLTPLIRFRRHTFIHKQKIKEVPTGEMGTETPES